MTGYVDHPDIEQYQRLSRILQATSTAVLPGPGRIEGTVAGDILAYFEGRDPVLYSRVPGASIVSLMAGTSWVEWPAVRSASSIPIAVHPFEPADTHWPVGADGRKSCVRSSNNNRIEKTLYLSALVGPEWLGTTFAFSKTLLKPAINFSHEADRVRVKIDGETVLSVGAIWRLSSELTPRDPRTGNQWYLPIFTRMGVLGEPNGPSLELVRRAKELRFKFKMEADTQRQARITAVTSTPPLIGVEPQRGTTTFTTGVKRWSDPPSVPSAPESSATPAPTASGAKPAIDPSLNDDIPWQD
jgi:hypothetical protein